MRRFFLAPLVLAFALAVSVQAAESDTTPPTLVSATRYTTNMYQIHVTFSERMDTNSVFQETNYRIRTLSGTPTRNLEAVIVETNTSVTPRSTTNVIITVAEELDLSRDWGLYVARVSDTNGNVMVGTNSVVIRSVSTLIPREGEWYRRDDAYYPEFSGFRFTDNSWAQLDYDYENQFLFGLAGFYLGLLPGNVVPPNGNTTLCCYPNEVETASTTSYFRTKFNVVGSLFNSTFAVKYFIDDGAIVYVNGKEVWRTNISAAITAPTYRTLANASGSQSWRPTGLLTLPNFNSAVVEGVNHIAVEVHQRSAVDGIAGFGLELIQSYTNRVGGAVSIVRQPISLTNVVEGTTATFDVLPDGKAPFKYKWFLIGTDGKTNAIANATNRILTIKPVPLANNGAKVFVEVVGALNANKVVSSNATLSVVPDVGVPSIVSAIYEEDTEGITLTFSEAMKPSTVLDKANYTLTNQFGETIAIGSIEDIDGSSVLIKPSTPLTAGGRVTLLPRNLTDNAGVPNALNNALSVQVGGVFTLVPFASEWHYYQQGTNPPVGAGWQTKAYVENNRWEVGNGLFYNEEDETVVLPSKNILLNLSDSDGERIITYYFRKTFDFRGATNGVKLTYGHYVDDGMVVWLNGQPAARFGNLTGVPLYTTFATDRGVDDAVLTNNVAFAMTNIVQGVNQLAVEVHQSSATSSDVVFDLELLATIPSIITTNAVVEPPVPPLKVVITGGNAVLSWTSAPTGTVLETTPTISPATWTTVAGATSPYSATLGGANNKARYYRLRKP